MSKASAPYPDIPTIVRAYKASRKVPPASAVAPYLYPIDRYTVAELTTRPVVRFYRWLPASRRTKYLYKFNGGPMVTTYPVVTGTPVVGQQLECSSGSWYGSIALSFLYAWLRDGKPFGPTGNTYITVEEDRLHDISCLVTATDITGSTDQESNIVIISLPTPQLLSVPVVTSNNWVDTFSYSTEGEWNLRDLSRDAIFQWKRRLPAETSSTPIPGATGSSYLLQEEDRGYFVTVEVTVYNNTGDASATSIDQMAVIYNVPQDITKPTIEGIFESGETVTTDGGTWKYTDDDVTYQYDWKLNGAPILPNPPNQPSYLIRTEDRHLNLSCSVIGTNPGPPIRVGFPAFSPIRYIIWPIPLITTEVLIEGTPNVDSVLTISQDAEFDYTDFESFEWIGTRPDGTIYRIAQDVRSYVVMSGDDNNTISVRWQGRNDDNNDIIVSYSNDIGPIVEPVPYLPSGQASRPRINGSVDVGGTAVAFPGRWLPNAPTTYLIEWLLGTVSQTPPVFGDTYTPQFQDINRQLSIRVIATNQGGDSDPAISAWRRVLQQAVDALYANLGSFYPFHAVVGYDIAANYQVNNAATITFQWYLDTEANPIPGATARQIPMLESYRTHYIFCIVTGSNSRPSQDSATSNKLKVTNPPVESPTTEPDITPKDPVAGGTLTCSTGVWPNALTYIYEWIKNGLVIETGNTYVTTNSDINSVIDCRVTATNDFPDAGQQFTAHSDQIRANGPILVTDPEVTGDHYVDSTLTCSEGVWDYASSYTYVWNRDGRPIIPAATGPSYLLQDDSRHTLISCTVTAIGFAGETTTFETPRVTVNYDTPVNETPPSISGTPSLGSELTCSDGTWRYVDTLYFTWYRGPDPTPIGSASKYTVEPRDVGTNLYCIVSGYNQDQPLSVVPVRAPDFYIPAIPPVQQRAPIVTLYETNLLVSDSGVWLFADTITNAWYNTDGQAPIGQGETYQITATDHGTTIYAFAYAENVVGITPGTDSNFIVVPPDVPQNVTLPVITAYPSGDPDLIYPGGSAQVSDGTWDDRDITMAFTYQWRRNGVPVPTETNNILVFSDFWNGEPVDCIVTAHNMLGSGTATALEKQIPGIKPVNVDDPTLEGSGEVGTTLVADPGTWQYAPDIEVNWYRNDALQYTGLFLVMDPTWHGDKIEVRVTAFNHFGYFTVATVPTTIYVTYPAPTNITPPALTGTILINAEQTCSQGIWDYPEDPKTYSYQWFSGVNPVGDPINTYTLQASDNNLEVYCAVTALESDGKSTTENSNSVKLFEVPILQTQPKVTYDSLIVGSTLTCDTGTWFYADSFMYQWFGTNQPISPKSATVVQYVLKDSDRNTDVLCRVEAKNNAGTTTKDSQTVRTEGVSYSKPKKEYVPVPKPVNKKRPVITYDTKRIGDFLSCDDGKWYAGVPKSKLTSESEYTIERQWLRNGEIRRTQTGSLYPLGKNDDGAIISCRITAVNSDTFASVISKGIRIKIEPEDSNNEEDS